MKILLCILLILSSSVSLLNAQNCKELLDIVIDLEKPEQTRTNFELLLKCKEYKIDAFDLNTSILSTILIETSIRKGTSITFRDLIQAYGERQQSPKYQKGKAMYFRSQLLSNKIVSLKTWEEDKKILLELNISEQDCQDIIHFFQDSLKQTEDDLKITYQSLINAFKKNTLLFL